MYVIELLQPDGPHWYGGKTRYHDTDVEGILWSPYWEDAIQFDERDEAETVKNMDCAKANGCYICPSARAMFEDTRSLYPGIEGASTIRFKYLMVNDSFIMDGIEYKIVDKKPDGFYFRSKDSKNKDARRGSLRNARFVVLLSQPKQKTVKEKPCEKLCSKADRMEGTCDCENMGLIKNNQNESSSNN